MQDNNSIFKRNRCINAKKEFILLDSDWYIQYESIHHECKFYYGLRLKYRNTGTDFKYIILGQSIGHDTEREMKQAIKSEVSRWLLEKQKEHNLDEIPVGQLQEFIHPQMKLF